jgi:hypothetical protein
MLVCSFLDGILKNEYDGDRLTEFRQLDSDTKKKFDAQNNRFRKIESAYSIQVFYLHVYRYIIRLTRSH